MNIVPRVFHQTFSSSLETEAQTFKFSKVYNKRGSRVEISVLNSISTSTEDNMIVLTNHALSFDSTIQTNDGTRKDGILILSTHSNKSNIFEKLTLYPQGDISLNPFQLQCISPFDFSPVESKYSLTLEIAVFDLV